VQAYRRFIDSTGFAWQVCEVAAGDPRPLADRPTPPAWLYFFSRGTTLVLRDFPREWEALSWRELEGLRRRADVLGSDSVVRVPAATLARREAAEVRA